MIFDNRRIWQRICNVSTSRAHITGGVTKCPSFTKARRFLPEALDEREVGFESTLDFHTLGSKERDGHEPIEDVVFGHLVVSGPL